MDNEATLVEVINGMLAEPDRQQALGYIKGVGFKLKGAEYRLKKLTDEVARFCAHKETDEFYFRVEWDHFITCLRSAFDYLAQLINVVYGLKLLPSHTRGKGAIADFKTVVNCLAKKEHGSELEQLLQKTVNNDWYEYLNSLRIQTIHVKPVTIRKRVSVTATAKAFIIATLSGKKIKAKAGEITEVRGGEAQAERREQPPGEAGARIEKLLLPDKAEGNTATKEIELISHCKTTLANVRDVIRKSYASLIQRLEGSK